MSSFPNVASLVGPWTYRSFLSDPDLSATFNDLEFGRANLIIYDAVHGVFKGRIFDVDPAFPWSLELTGSINYGNPYDLRFQGRGVVKGEEWIYDYEGYVIRPWPNGVDQRPAFVGTVIRTVTHSQGKSKAGVVASFIAVRQDETDR
jgi:hypothetical protein